MARLASWTERQLFGLAHRGFRQAHDMGSRQPAGQVDFHHHLGRGYAFLGTTERNGQAHDAIDGGGAAGPQANMGTRNSIDAGR